jgi:hypothetical protein
VEQCTGLLRGGGAVEKLGRKILTAIDSVLRNTYKMNNVAIGFLREEKGTSRSNSS